MRISDGTNPLDATSVHPESYPAAEAMLEKLHIDKDAIAQGGAADIEEKISLLYAADEKPKQSGTRKKGLAALAELSKPKESPKKNLGKAIEKLSAELDIGAMTVSYTHLDVYKRQIKNPGDDYSAELLPYVPEAGGDDRYCQNRGRRVP